MKNRQDEWFEKLRQMADQEIKKRPGHVENIGPADLTRLIDEIQVFQVELELQNEELRSSLEELEKSRTRFSRLFDMAPAGYVVLDDAGMIRHVNQTLMDMLKKSPDALLGKPFSRFIAPEDQGVFLSRFKAFYKHPADKTLEIRLVSDRRFVCHARLQGGFIPFETGPGEPDIDQFCLIVTDITASKAAEKKETQARQYLETILKTTADGFWVLDTQGNIIEANDAFCKMTGYTKGSLLEMTINDLDDIESPEETAARVERILTHGSEFFETRHRRRDGTTFPIEVSVTWMASGGERLVCFGRDITERKQAEKRILHLQKTESLGRMAGAMAHHYNNLLTTVMGNLELAMYDVPGDSRVTGNLEQAMQAAQRISKLGATMLAYLGQTNTPRERLDLSETCRTAVSAFQAEMPPQIFLKTDFPEPGPVILANAGRIRQILEIFVTNAREAMEKRKGTIILDIRTVLPRDITSKHRYPIDFHPGSSACACIRIQDSGPGIPKNDLEKIFDPFYSTKFTGRGLGLPIALGTVKSLGGCITVSTTPGSGSVFQVFLPAISDKLLLKTDL
jgi:PAS domain S-box-containing protein